MTPKPTAILGFALAAGATMGVHSSSPAPPPSDSVASAPSSPPPVASVDRLERRPADAYLGNRHLSASGDFDDDGRLDEAFFLKAGDKNARALSLVVSFGSPTKRDRIVLTFEETDAAIRNVGLKTARPGTYTGACTRGAGGPCGEGEDTLDLPHDGIVFFWYESASRLYYLPQDALDGDFKVFHLSD